MELALVLALIIIITALAYPSLDAMYGSYRATAAADMVRASWASARSRAVNDGQSYRFAVVFGKGNYRIAPDSADAWSGGDGAANSTTPPLIVEDALPKGVCFTNSGPGGGGDLSPSSDTVLPPGSVDPASYTPTAVFLPDGTARDDVEITFVTRGAQPVVLRLRALTGIVTVKTLTPQGGR
jgi:hypothetical protein